MARTDIVDRFSSAGGKFITPAGDFAARLDKCRAVVFDWDGVFNDGRKGQGSSSGFSEADSMGTNMLRYGLWRKHGELPYTAIISGENNEGAIAFAKREGFTAVYTGIRRKQDVIAHLCEKNGLQPGGIACVFDDINDLAMAEVCGLRLMVRRESSPLLADLARHRKLCDYLTGSGATGHAVREICELLLGILGSYDAVVDSRVASDEEYENYFNSRQAVDTSCYSLQGEVIATA